MEANAQQLIAQEAVEAIPELGFDQTANLTAEAGHDRLVADAGADADVEPVPELEFDQTANLTAEAGHDRLVAHAGAGAGADAPPHAEPIPVQGPAAGRRETRELDRSDYARCGAESLLLQGRRDPEERR